MQQLFAAWAAVGGVIFNAGYALTLYRLWRRPEAAMQHPFNYGTWILFALATTGYCGYFIVVRPDPVMAAIAAVGLLLIVAIITTARIRRLPS